MNILHLSFVNLAFFAAWLFFWVWKKPKIQIVILIVSILPVWSFFRNTDFNGGMVQNSAFAMAFYDSLAEGNIIPRWAEKLDTQFGYPAFLYLYPLPFYLSSVFHVLGFGFVDSVKWVFVITYILSGIWMWKWARLKFSEYAAMAATIAYLFAPYRLVNVHFRMDIGESVAIALLPLLFFYIERGKKPGITLVTFLLILAHPAISTAGIGLALVYLLTKSNFKNILFLVLGVSLATYYWLPIFAEGHYANVTTYTKSVEFFAWQDYIYSPFRFGLLYQGGVGKMNFPIGYTILPIVITSFMFLKKLNKRVKFWLAAFLVICFMFLPVAKIVWTLPILNKFQFSYRLQGVMTLVTAMIVGYFFQKYRNNLLIGLFVIITSGITLLNWGNREYRAFKMPDYELKRLLPVQSRMWGTGFPQALPRWTDINNLWGPEKISGPIDILAGQGKVWEIARKSTRHEYRIRAETDMKLRENTFYYPGWKLYINGEEKQISFENSQEPGTMEFEVGKGENNVVLVFKETNIRKFALMISLITNFLLIFSMISKNKYKAALKI